MEEGQTRAFSFCSLAWLGAGLRWVVLQRALWTMPFSSSEISVQARALTGPGAGASSGTRPHRWSPCMTGCSDWQWPCAPAVGSCGVVMVALAHTYTLQVRSLNPESSQSHSLVLQKD